MEIVFYENNLTLWDVNHFCKMFCDRWFIHYVSILLALGVCVCVREFGRSKWRLTEHESVMESTEKLEYKLVEKTLI